MPDAALWVTYGKINSNPLTSKRIVVQPLPTNTPTTLCLDEEAGRRAAHMKWISSGPYVCSDWDQSATIKFVIMKGRGDPGVWAPSIWLVFLCVGASTSRKHIHELGVKSRAVFGSGSARSSQNRKKSSGTVRQEWVFLILNNWLPSKTTKPPDMRLIKPLPSGYLRIYI